jgi:transcriptional regulator with XRE-family HTH domain
MNQTDFGAELASRLGVEITQSTLSSWEKGARAPAAAALMAVLEIANELGVRPAALIEPEIGGEVPAMIERLAALTDAIATQLDPDHAARLREVAAEISHPHEEHLSQAGQDQSPLRRRPADS